MFGKTDATKLCLLVYCMQGSPVITTLSNEISMDLNLNDLFIFLSAITSTLFNVIDWSTRVYHHQQPFHHDAPRQHSHPGCQVHCNQPEASAAKRTGLGWACCFKLSIPTTPGGQLKHMAAAHSHWQMMIIKHIWYADTCKGRIFNLFFFNMVSGLFLIDAPI